MSESLLPSEWTGNCWTEEEPSSMQTTYKIEIVNIPGKGAGLVTNDPIPAYSRILAESPILHLQQTDVARLFGYTGDDCPSPSTFRKLLARCRGPTTSLTSEEASQKYAALCDCTAEKTDGKTMRGIWKSNVVEIGGEPHTSAVFETISRMNHSCCPNVEITWNEALEQQTAHAIRDISSGEELCISYTYLFSASAERRASLQGRYRFECRCTACSLSGCALATSDCRRRRLETFDDASDQWCAKPREGVQSAQEAIDLIDEEFGGDPSLQSSFYCKQLELFVIQGLWVEATNAANAAQLCYSRSQGDDSSESRQMRFYAKNPRMHPAARKRQKRAL